jgi:hypothetical protein
MKLAKLTFTIAVALLALLAIPLQLTAQDHSRYKLIDLGTFGGPASYLTNGFDGILNHHGMVAGWADTSTPDPDPTFASTSIVSCLTLSDGRMVR